MKRFPFYKQPDNMDCGPTCLRMISKYYGRDIPLQSIRNDVQIGREGSSLLGISEAAEAIGFRAQPLKLNFPALVEEAVLPALLFWNRNHFVVLYKIHRNKFFIADPAKGLITYDEAEFRAHWISDREDAEDEGVALLLEPAAQFYEEKEDFSGKQIKKKEGRGILRYLNPYRKLIVQVFIGLIVASLLQLLLPFLTQSVVDTGINTGNIHFVYVILLAQLALFAGRLAVEFVRSWLLLHISSRINISILTDFLVKLMKLPVAFFDSKQTGDILQRMNDHQRIESFLTGSSLSVLFSLLNIVVFSVVLAIYNSSILWLFLFSTLLYSAWIAVFLKKRRILDYKKFDVAAREQSTTIQLVQGMQEIKLNGAERPLRWGWERLQVSLFRLNMKSLSLNQWQQAGGFLINEGKNILITFLSAKAVIDGDMTLGAMLAVQYIIGQLNSPIEQMVSFVQTWQNARISMDRLNEVHQMEDEEPDDRYFQQELPASFARNLMGGRSDEGYYFAEQAQYTQAILHEKDNDEFLRSIPIVDIKNVSFTYPGAGNEPVLNDINIAIPKGKTTAIVGASGSGKTTLLKLLLRFYEPQKGTIEIGRTPLAAISHRTWRSHCGVVMQETYIFSDTIARNIAVGQDKIDMSRLYRAAQMANTHFFIESLPLRYNTMIGSEGMGVSMGQKQRILIARAIYRDPDFIFFDEATNSLDANNESTIVRNLEHFFKGRTVLVVAHRLSTVKNADQIIVLNKGTVIETGTHQELTELRGTYFNLVKSQLEVGD